MLMDVGHENLALVHTRKSIGLIYSRASMGTSMPMVNNSFNIFIYVRIEMLSSLSMINTPGHHMKQMRYHTRTDEKLTLGIVIYPPRVTEPMSNHFKSLFDRMVFPYATVHIDPFFLQQIFWKIFLMAI